MTTRYKASGLDGPVGGEPGSLTRLEDEPFSAVESSILNTMEEAQTWAIDFLQDWMEKGDFARVSVMHFWLAPRGTTVVEVINHTGEPQEDAHVIIEEIKDDQ